jgi:serine O-acetyltransferase
MYRIAHWLLERRVPALPAMITAHAVARTGAEILPAAQIGPGLLLPHPVGVVIGGGATVGRNCTILQSVTLGEKYSHRDHTYPIVLDGATICAGAVVLGGVTIGRYSLVAANAVVTRDVNDFETVGGVPAVRLVPVKEPLPA